MDDRRDQQDGAPVSPEGQTPPAEGFPSWAATRIGPPVENPLPGQVEPPAAGAPLPAEVPAPAETPTVGMTPAAAQPQVAEPQVTQPQVAQPQMAQPQTAQPQVAQPQMAQPQTALPQQTPLAATPPPRRRGRGLLVLAGLIALAATAAAIGWFVGNQGASTTDAETAESADAGDADQAGDADGGATGTGDEGGAETEAGTDDEPASPSTTEATDGTDESEDDGESTETTASGPFVVPETADNPSGATQYAVMAGTTATMRGWYPTAEIAQQAVADAATIMGGMENVIDETEVDPRAEIRPDSFAVYFENYVLFETDSAEITEEFYEFLGFPLFFMMNSPDATVTVVARTDASGPADYNLELATRRAEAVRDHWLANGGNADQIILDPRGEEGADEDATDEQKALDRRVELQVSGFLAG